MVLRSRGMALKEKYHRSCISLTKLSGKDVFQRSGAVDSVLGS